MNKENLKRPANEYGTFKFFKVNKSGLEVTSISKPHEPRQAKPLESKPNFIVKTLNPVVEYSLSQKPNHHFQSSIQSILFKLKQISPIDLKPQSQTSNALYQKTFEKLQKIKQDKEKLLQYYQQEQIKRENAQNKAEVQIKEIEHKIIAVESERSILDAKVKNIQRSLKFMKDFSNIEIFQVLEKPKGVIAAVKYEGNQIRFKLVDGEEGFEYGFISSNIAVARIPEVFKEDIVFDKSQFKMFYITLMEFLQSLD